MWRGGRKGGGTGVSDGSNGERVARSATNTRQEEEEEDEDE